MFPFFLQIDDIFSGRIPFGNAFVLSVGNARGFGFVAIEGQEEDVFIPADRTGGALRRNCGIYR